MNVHTHTRFTDRHTDTDTHTHTHTHTRAPIVGLKLSPLVFNCGFYRTKHKANRGPHGTES